MTDPVRPGATPPSGDDLDASLGHVAFEVAAMEAAAGMFLQTRNSFILESFLIHVRLLREFFWERWDDRDHFAGSAVYAENYWPDPTVWRVCKGSIARQHLRDTKDAIDKQLAHLARERADSSFFTNLTAEVEPLRGEILCHLAAFMAALQGLSPRWAFLQAALAEKRIYFGLVA